MTPYVFPEDFGAVGDGHTDDTGACQAALSACPASMAVMFSMNYAISSQLVPGNTSITAQPGSSLIGVGGCAKAFAPFVAGNKRYTLPSMIGFLQAPLVLAAGVMKIKVHEIQNCGGAVELQGNAINNTIDVQWIAGCGSCLKVSNPVAGPSTGPVIQGNVMSVNFAVSCLKGLTFDGSYNCDSNALIFGSWDSNSIKGACVFENTFSGGHEMLSTWRLWVTEWLGGLLAAPDGMIANGPMQFCRFKTANFATFAQNWDAIAVQPGGGNTFEASSAAGYASSFQANWMDASNKRATFGAAAYQNTRLCAGAFGPHTGGDLVKTYVYTPFTDGNSFSYRAQPVVNPGLVLHSITDNSATVKGEVCITWRVMQGWVGIAPFSFQFTSGVP